MRRAFSSIQDSNVATLITCVILFWFGDQFGASLVKGFALTLALGVSTALAQKTTSMGTGGGGATEAELREKVGIDPLDHESRLNLANLLAGQRRYREAMDELLEIVRLARHWQDGAARTRLLALFTLAGNDQALVSEYRRKLANALVQLAPRDLTIWFVTSRKQLEGDLRRVAPAKGEGSLWVAWPKKTSGVITDVTEDVLREVILPMGLVDRKVCAIDEIWSGLLFSWRRT